MITLEPSPLGHEALDDPDCPPALARRLLTEIARSNFLFGGRAAVLWGVWQLLRAVPVGSRLTLLDVGAGSGDIARAVARLARRLGIRLVPLALDPLQSAAILCREAGLLPVRASAAALPVRPNGVDLVIASQFLHHFARPSAVALARTFATIARVGVVIAEPRRTPPAMAGIWLAALALGFHPQTRRDGVLSVRRSYRVDEFRRMFAAASVPAVVRRRPGFRLVGYWRTDDAHR